MRNARLNLSVGGNQEWMDDPNSHSLMHYRCSTQDYTLLDDCCIMLLSASSNIYRLYLCPIRLRSVISCSKKHIHNWHHHLRTSDRLGWSLQKRRVNEAPDSGLDLLAIGSVGMRPGRVYLHSYICTNTIALWERLVEALSNHEMATVAEYANSSAFTVNGIPWTRSELRLEFCASRMVQCMLKVELVANCNWWFMLDVDLQ